MKTARPIDRDFILKMVRPEAECWTWTGAVSNSGYGQFFRSIKGRTKGFTAHRAAYSLFVGPIPDGMMVLHRCDVKLCCNPNHLYLGDAKQNAKDAIERGQHPRGVRHGNAKLTEQAVVQIRRLYAAGGTTQRELARRFGVSQEPIGRVVRREGGYAEIETVELSRVFGAEP